ncbi:MAG TPA: hypothetical protein VI855_01975, partial [Dehalococcoidia bacterium]|nr:hypothetical protein [Dehalococcoidia bacterium]
MALTVNNFVGFETGGLEEANSTSGAPSVQSTIVRSGTYALLLAGAVTRATYSILATISGGTGIYGFSFQTTTVIPTNNTDFFYVSDNLATIVLRLRLNAISGDVTLIDANNVVVGTITAPFSANTWYYIEVAHTITTAEVFINGTSVLSVTAQDFYQEQTVVEFTFQGDNVATQDIYIDDVYAGQGTSSADRLTSSVNVPRAYQNTAEDGTDVGDALATGTWAAVSETPTTTNAASYTANPATGGTTTDEGTRLGPTGGPTLGTIKAAKWIHRLQRGTGAGTTHYKRYGNSGDGMTDEVVALNTSYANYFT